jgi:hypothetical protein
MYNKTLALSAGLLLFGAAASQLSAPQKFHRPAASEKRGQDKTAQSTRSGH